jgi:hypothetical protein
MKTQDDHVMMKRSGNILMLTDVICPTGIVQISVNNSMQACTFRRMKEG